VSAHNVDVTVNGNVVASAGFIKWIQGTGTSYTVAVDFQTDYITVTDNATGAGTSLSVGGVFKSPLAADDVLAWVAPFSATVTSVKGWQDTGTGSVVNAFRGSLASAVTFLSSDMTLAVADTVQDGGAVQNATVAIGDPVYIRLTSVSGSPNEVGVQISLTRT
jgi:hypothetical protein